MTCMEFLKVDALVFLVNEISEMETQLNISRNPTNLKSRTLLSIFVFVIVFVHLTEVPFD